MDVVVILTCFNRKEKTSKSIESIVNGNKNIKFTFIIVDDNSTDGTIEMLYSLKKKYDLKIIRGEGNLYYSGGMRKGMQYALEHLNYKYDYLLMINDDVEFFERSINKLIKESIEQKDAIIVGATCNGQGYLSYGAIKYEGENSIKYNKVGIEESKLECDTFNANCVLIPFQAFLLTGLIDKKYKHSLGDFDYGISLKNKGYKIYSSSVYIGKCEENSLNNTWLDTTLSRRARLKLKENVKGAPRGPWFYFLRKNFGLIQAIKYSLTPYVKIVIKR